LLGRLVERPDARANGRAGGTSSSEPAARQSAPRCSPA